MNSKYIVLFLLLFVLNSMTIGQTVENDKIKNYTRDEILNLSKDELLELQLEDIMYLVKKLKLTSIDEFYTLYVNPKVNSASKKEEELLYAPLSINVITHKEIINSGALNIPEALRLIPNVIVREKTNGNYDVHIRGNDNIPPGKLLFDSENTLTLVMIDNRPVYNNFQGGTFWESLPISIEDIDKIEVVSSSCSSMYGPNAVTGVIHIITKKSYNHTDNIHAHYQMGSYNTTKAYLRASKRFNSKFSSSISANYQRRERIQNDYYNFYESRYLNINYLQNITDNFEGRYADPDLALENVAINLFADYKDRNTAIGIAAGTQQSHIQTIYLDFEDIPITGRKSNMSYFDFRSNWKNFITQFSINNGVQDNIVGIDGYKFGVTDIFSKLEYTFKPGKFIFSPGISYTSSIFNDEPYTDSIDNQLFGSNVHLNNIAAYLRTEYKPIDRLRFVVSFRYDNYELPKKDYLSYQFSVGYKINENSTIHFNYGKAFRGPFMYYYKLNTQQEFYFTETGESLLYIISSNPDLKLISMNMFEFSFRHIFDKNFSTDFTVYHYFTKDYPTKIVNIINDFVYEENYINSDVTSNHTGASLIFKYTLNSQLLVKLFGNIQSTFLENFNPPGYNNQYKIDFIHKTTPTTYGGFSINYRPIKKLNLNTNLYYMSDQEFYSIDGILPLKSSYLLNTKLSYTFYKKCNVFINGRNILDNSHIEFPFADKTSNMLLFGVNLRY